MAAIAPTTTTDASTTIAAAAIADVIVVAVLTGFFDPLVDRQHHLRPFQQVQAASQMDRRTAHHRAAEEVSRQAEGCDGEG